MKVKDLYKKYNGYSFELFGRPLEQRTIPFTFLPKDKELKECEVVDYIVEEKEFEQHCFNMAGEYKRTEKMKGYVRAYIR